MIISGAAAAIAITCLGLGIFFDPRSPGESIVKDRWKDLFEALGKGTGQEIIEKCTLLTQQKEQRQGHYEKCLGELKPEDIAPFFHKTFMVAHLLVAMESLEKGDAEKVKSHAYTALSHYEMSNFAPELERFAKAIIDSPAEIRRMMDKYQIVSNIHSLDFLVSQRRIAREEAIKTQEAVSSALESVGLAVSNSVTIP